MALPITENTAATPTRVVVASHGNILKMAIARIAAMMGWVPVSMSLDDLYNGESDEMGSNDLLVIGVNERDVGDPRLQKLFGRLRGTPVVAFSEGSVSDDALYQLSDDIRGMIGSDSTEDQIQAVLMLAESGFRIRPAAVPSAASGTPSSRRNTHGILRVLTKREYDVLCEIADGRSNKEIALSLGISVNTVDIHVSSIIQKLQVKNRLQAALMLRPQDRG